MQGQAPATSLHLSSGSQRAAHRHLQIQVKEGVESDDEVRRVPEFGGENPGPSTSGREASSTTAAPAPAASSGRTAASSESRQRKRGRSSSDKEQKRLKRLLRNRVSAQQARERKKAYLTELEAKVSDLERKNSELDERFSTLQNENQMLRQILKNTTVGRKAPSTSGSGEASV